MGCLKHLTLFHGSLSLTCLHEVTQTHAHMRDHNSNTQGAVRNRENVIKRETSWKWERLPALQAWNQSISYRRQHQQKTDSDINCINHLRYKISEWLKKALSHVPGIILNTPVFFTSFTNTVGLHRAVLCMIVASFEYSVITRAGHFPTILHLNIRAHKKPNILIFI